MNPEGRVTPSRALPRAAISWVILALFLLPMLGCSLLGMGGDPTPSGPFHDGITLLADGEFPGADQAFRESASRCESGEAGRRAILFLSLLALDPRNPAANPDSAALMASRFLNLPNKTPDQALEAEALYVAALDRGADPTLRIDPAAPGLAVRFGDCDKPFPPRVVRPLPILGTRDSLPGGRRTTLTQENESLRSTVGDLQLTVAGLQAELDSLQAELERIRTLMRLPDTTIVPVPGGA